MNKPKIQILLATFNGEKYLREQLDSLLKQTYRDWECLISDDCSTDKTLSIIEEYCDLDDRFILVSQGTRYYSASYNFLHLMSVSDADYILFCDQDDFWLENKVEVLVNKICAVGESCEPGVPICVFSDARLVDSELRSLDPESFQSTLLYDAGEISLVQLLASNVVQGSASIINRRLVDIVTDSSDYAYFRIFDWFVGAIAKSQGRLVYVPEKLHLYRQHGSNSIGVQNLTLYSWIRMLIRCNKSEENGLKEEIKRECWVFPRARRILECFPPVDLEVLEELEYLSSFIDYGFKGRIKILNHYKWFNYWIGFKISLLIFCFKGHSF